MNAGKFHVFPAEPGNPVTGAPAGWTIVAGAPVARTFVKYLGEDRTMLSGVWECSEGEYEVTYAAWEFCHMIAGRCTITPDGGTPVVLEPGSTFILEPGFTGTWKVDEAMRKYFVFRLPAPLPLPSA